MAGFVPEFLRRHAEFLEHRARVRTVPDWVEFSRKWFNPAEWPEKTPAELGAEAMRKRALPAPRDGRTWKRSCYRYDISAEARYEMRWTIATVGDPIRFPHLGEIPKVPGSGWEQECPHCEIGTRDLGDDECPECGRTLIRAFRGE